jgi:large repetitive protein
MNVHAIAAGTYHSLALRSDGAVAGWGFDGYGQATVPQGLPGASAVAAGGAHNLAITAGAPPAVMPAVSTQPTDQAVRAGDTVTFTTAASGFPTPSVQWQVSVDGGATWNDVAGAHAGVLSFTAVAGDNSKQYRAVFTNAGGTVTSSVAKLAVEGGFTPLYLPTLLK